MAIDYVDAGQAIENSSLSGIVGSAPPVTDGVTYERILNARSEPQNWLTYYGAYDGQRYSPLDQITKENVSKLKPEWVFQCGSVGLHSGKSTYSFEASPLVVDGIMYVSGWQHPLAVPDGFGLRRVAVLRQREPGRRGRRGQGLRHHSGRPHHRA